MRSQMLNRLAFPLAALPAMAALWLLLASWVWSAGTQTEFSTLAWWDGTQWWLSNWWVNLWLILGAALPTAILICAGFVAFQLRWRWSPRSHSVLRGHRSGRPAIERGVSDNHGHAAWRSMAEAKKLFPGPHPKWGGIAVGEAYRVDQDRSVAGIPFDPHNSRTWGRGGREELLIDPCTQGSGHSLVFSGTGQFKTTTAVSTALTWTGSSVIMDPSTEMGPMLSSALRSQGKEVVQIGVPNAEQPGATGFNVLAWIDINSPDAELHVQSVVGWIYDEQTGASARREDAFFTPMGKQLVTCLLAHLVWSAAREVEISLATLAAGLAMPETDMVNNLKGIARSSNSLLARRLAATLSNNAAPETFSGVFLNAVKGVNWLFTTAHADVVSHGFFDPQRLLTARTTVFLNISLRTLETTPPIARVLVGALLNTVYMAEGRTKGKVLFLIDEAARLGHLRVLETARDTGRKYALCLHMLWQSIGQMIQIWGQEGTQAWIDAASWIGYASIRAAGAGRELSHALGTHSVLAWSEGDNSGRQRPANLGFGSISRGTNHSVHETARQLISAAELQQDLREDEIVIVPASGLPIRCGRAVFFRRKEFAAVVESNRFLNKEVANG